MSSTVPLDKSSSLKRSPLDQLHRELGAVMIPFAGYEMPMQYRAGIIKEHLHTRASAGLFDVSHMGQFTLRPCGTVLEAARALEALVPVDVVTLLSGRQRYAFFTNASGGILDDLMIANRGDALFLVVNAACKDADEALLRSSLSEACAIKAMTDRALLGLQGPGAQSVLARLTRAVADMRFMDIRSISLLGADCVVSRSGYTGEDGFEISVPGSIATELARVLLADPGVLPVGLGARDTLRLEAGLCLYGSDLDATTTPIEAALEWAIQRSRREGGARAGGFPGAEVILRQLADGPARRRVGLRPEGKVPLRRGAELYGEPNSQTAVGAVTSGGFGPSVQTPIAMGYIATGWTDEGKTLFAKVRGQSIPVHVVRLPFVPTRYKRN